MQRFVRVALVVAAAITLAAPNARAQADSQVITLDLPAQSLDTSLRLLGTATGTNVLFNPGLVIDRKAPALKGPLTVDKALTLLLQGTGLEYRFVDATTVSVTRAPATPVKPSAADKTALPSHEERATDEDSTKEGESTSSSIFRVAQANALAATSVDKADQEQVLQKDPTRLEEVVVTAEKRAERLHDVPVPVTTVNTTSLAESDQTRLNDYYTQIPGLTVSSDGYQSSLSTIAIRGITTGGFGYPTVGSTLDDVPIGSATTYGGGVFAPDLDPSDLAHIEVLRGPQGTLYGANSMGGLLKYVTVDPSTAGFTGRLQLGGSGAHNGAQAGYNVRGAANIPLSDTIALRVSAFTRQEPGYIDNVLTSQSGLNESRTSGGRLAALWQPNADFSLKLSGIYQDARQYGFSFVDLEPGLADLQQRYARNTGQSTYQYQFYTATATANLNGISLVALTGFSLKNNFQTYDDSLYGGFYGAGNFNVTGAVATAKYRYSKFSQEIRLAAPIGAHFEWVLGAFYTYEDTKGLQVVYAADPSIGTYLGQLASFNFPTTFTEAAGFIDLTYHFTDQFDVQLGGRESGNRQAYQETDAGYYLGSADAVHVNPTFHSDDNSFTYLVTPRWKLSPDLMMYARLASGYRPGGPNTTLTAGIPPQFSPDKTRNYELGLKSDVLDHTLSFDLSLYYINWKNIQISLVGPGGAGYFANGSEAKSAGVELSMEARPMTGTHLAAWLAYDDAVLTQNLPTSSAVFGLSGDRLPNSSRFSGNVSLSQDFSLTDALAAHVGGSVSYVGAREGVFASIYGAGQRQIYPSYPKLDLLAGLKYDSWDINFFANNVTDKRGELAGGLGTGFDPHGFILIQPRTVGLSVVKTL